MKNFMVLTAIFAALTLTNCQDITQSSPPPIEANPELDNFGTTSLDKGQNVWFWADADQNPIQEGYFNAWLLKVNDQGQLKANTSQHFPEDKQTHIDLYGLHGDFEASQIEENTTLFPSETGLKFNVEADQSKIDDNGTLANYDQSDLLYGIKKSVAPLKKAVDIPFVHMLCNVGIVLRAAKNAHLTDDKMKNIKVSILNTKTSATFTPTKDISQEDLKNDIEKRGAMIKLSPSEEQNQIQIPTRIVPKGGSFDGAEYGQAIIIPQEAPSGPFIQIQLEDGTLLSYTLPPGTKPFVSGTYYRYNVTVSDTLDVECSTSTKWTDGSSQDVVSLSLDHCGDFGWRQSDENYVESYILGPMDLKMGDYLYITSDGKKGTKWDTSDGGYRIYSNGEIGYEKVEPDLRKGQCIGIVVKAGRSTSGDWADNTDYKDKKGNPINQIHGYALALFEANDKKECYWGPEYDYVGTWSAYNDTQFTGYSNTLIIKAHAGSEERFKSVYPAPYFASEGYEIKRPAPDNTSGWYLPSVGQAWCVFQGMDYIEKSIINANGDKLIGLDAPSDAYSYWTSSEGGDSNAHDFIWDSFTQYSSGKSQSENMYARSMLTF